MRWLGLSSLLAGGVLIILLTSTILLAYVMYLLSYSKAFKWNTTDTTKADTKGIEAQEFWTDNKTKLIIPTVGNIIGMVLVTLLFVMG